MTAVTDRRQLQQIAARAADARVNVELETEGMTLNIGPQHPATHGTLRIVARLDGEQVVAAEPIAGYMHRNGLAGRDKIFYTTGRLTSETTLIPSRIGNRPAR